jgi:glycosyltransferase involved in cell wall biosynthesis
MVAGDGPRRHECEMWVHRLGLDRQVRFLGFWPREKMPQLFHEADAFIFTSLRDSFGSVLLEAMAHALPILALDHQGARVFVPPEAGIKVAVTTPEETVANLAEGIRRLCRSPKTRWKMGEAGWRYARTQTWDCRAAQMSQWYDACLQRDICC